MNDAANGSRIWSRYLAPRWHLLTMLCVLMVATIGLQLMGPQLLSRFVDGVRDGQSSDTLLGVAGLFVVVALGAQLIWVASEYVGSRLAWSATNELRLDLLNHCLALDLGFFERRGPGELVERIDGDIGKLANYFSRLFLLVFVNLLLVIGIGVVLFVENWVVGLAYAAFVVISVILLRRRVGSAVPALTAQREAEARQLGYLEERLAALEDVRGVGAARHVTDGFWQAARRVFRAGVRAAPIGVRWPATAEVLAALGYSLALAAGAGLFLAGEISLGTVFAFMAYLTMVRVPLFVITMQFREMEDARVAMRRIRKLFAERSAVAGGDRERVGGVPAISFTDVTFGYDPARPVLHDVSVEVPAGTVLGVAGRTGSGKSTMMRLLARFADPQQGAVRLDGVDIREFTLDSLRRTVGLVTQEVQILHASVRDNVTMFDDTVPESRVRQALEELGLGPWLASLPKELDTVLGAGDHGLSAGQEQLLAFARVIIADPAIVILDEATSRMDSATQLSVQRAIERLFAGRTGVIIAHRLETLRDADQIVLLDQGRISERGSFAELAANPESTFYRMLTAAGVSS